MSIIRNSTADRCIFSGNYISNYSVLLAAVVVVVPDVVAVVDTNVRGTNVRGTITRGNKSEVKMTEVKCQ